MLKDKKIDFFNQSRDSILFKNLAVSICTYFQTFLPSNAQRPHLNHLFFTKLPSTVYLEN